MGADHWATAVVIEMMHPLQQHKQSRWGGSALVGSSRPSAGCFAAPERVKLRFRLGFEEGPTGVGWPLRKRSVTSMHQVFDSSPHILVPKFNLSLQIVPVGGSAFGRFIVTISRLLHCTRTCKAPLSFGVRRRANRSWVALA